MPTIQEQILDTFLEELGARDDFTKEIVSDLRELLEKQGKPKPAELEKVLSPESQEDEL